MSEKRQLGEDGFQRFRISENHLVPDRDGGLMFVADHERIVYGLRAALTVERDDCAKAEHAYQLLRADRRFEAAKAAMQGLLADGYGPHGWDGIPTDATKVAATAVSLADALLAELDRPREEPGSLHEDD